MGRKKQRKPIKPRQKILIEKSIAISIGKKAYDMRLVDSPLHRTRIIEVLMKAYLGGAFDNMLSGVKLEDNRNLSREILTAGVERELKIEFEHKAWEKGTISIPSESILLIEYLGGIFIKENINEIIYNYANTLEKEY